MCRYCVEYGKGTKWYLNPDNYNPELYEKPGHAVSFNMLCGADKNTFELGAARDLEPLLPDYNFPGEFNVALATVCSIRDRLCRWRMP
jgi:hypothetical protein